MATLHTKVKIPDQVTYSEVAGELVLLDMESGKYFGLDEVGARMYALLADYGCLENAYLTLLDEYKVEAAKLESDLINLVDDLTAQKLLLIVDS